MAVDGKLSEEQMIKRVFVFSDMEFYRAWRTPWETDYQAIVMKFGEKGYWSSAPEIVFWNLGDSRATPMPRNQKGVALVSEFSEEFDDHVLGGKWGFEPRGCHGKGSSW